MLYLYYFSVLLRAKPDKNAPCIELQCNEYINHYWKKPIGQKEVMTIYVVYWTLYILNNEWSNTITYVPQSSDSFSAIWTG